MNCAAFSPTRFSFVVRRNATTSAPCLVLPCRQTLPLEHSTRIGGRHENHNRAIASNCASLGLCGLVGNGRAGIDGGCLSGTLLKPVTRPGRFWVRFARYLALPAPACCCAPSLYRRLIPFYREIIPFLPGNNFLRPTGPNQNFPLEELTIRPYY
jgi:hypothetical protein